MEIVAAVILYVAFATTKRATPTLVLTPPQPAAPGEFSAGDVSVDHAGASTEVFGFESDAVPNSLIESVRARYMPTTGNGSNEYNGADAGFFVSDGPILPPPTEMEPEEGFTLREWRR
ncbi:hypothetical protein OIU77_001243 [Salix suchowensis]|uniref:Uncharacterized protein n=1 Tax=Salix suchowensis TaxID=1278906 RepID=A0ABQ9B241_9ROSI|nr:hypothetical protein OIU77_001243 [Salix suchowensis]